MTRGRKNTPEDFWEKVDIKSKDECWVWKGNYATNGYGQFPWKGYGAYLTHRLSYELTYGEIPEGLHVLHDADKCHSKGCVNPNHLRIGTHAQNKQDKDVAKLDWGKVSDIRAKYPMGSISIVETARRRNMSVKAIRDVIYNESWIDNNYMPPKMKKYKERKIKYLEQKDGQ